MFSLLKVMFSKKRFQKRKMSSESEEIFISEHIVQTERSCPSAL